MQEMEMETGSVTCLELPGDYIDGALNRIRS